MNCARCGSPLRESATFCTNCGLPTTPPQVGELDAASTLANDPTIRSSGASGPAPAGSSSGAYDPTVMARPSAPSMYPAGSGQMPGASGPALVPASVPMDAPTVASSSPGSVPYGYPPAAGSGSVPYGVPPDGSGASPYASTVYGAPSQPFPPAPPPEFLVPPPPPAPPLTLRLFGADADALGARPNTRTQAWLLRNIPLNYVVSKWFMAIGGAVIALGVGLLLTLLAQALLGNGIASAFGASGDLGSASTENSLLNPGLLGFFALEHQVSLTLHITGSLSADETYTFPLLGLLLVPALALVLGGFLSAASDFQRHPRFSIARGALIGPFYAILLLLLSFLSSSTLSNSSLDLPSGSTATISPSVLQECLFGLLWGTLFGALGGWIQLTGRRFVTIALPSLQTLRSGRLAGALTGAGAALVCGILLFTGFVFAYLVYSIVGVAGGGSQLNSGGISTSGLTTWAILRVGLSLGPGAAIWLFALGTGAPISMSATGASTTSIGFIGATINPGKSSALYYLLLLGPAISYFVGGRIAARTARAQRTSDAFTAGALMALPLSILLALAALLLPIAVSATVSGLGSQTFMATEGPAFGGTFLAVLIAGAVVGGIGGASALAAPQLGSLPRLLLIPLRPIGLLLSRLLDGLTGRPKGEQRSGAMLWFYDSVLLAVILAVVMLVAIPVAPALASSPVPFSVVRGVIVWVATLLVGLPLLYLIGSLVTAFSSPAGQPAVHAAIGSSAQAFAPQAATPGFSPIIAPPSQPFPAGTPAYGTGPLQGGMPAAPGSQPFPPGVYTPPGSQQFAPPSQPFPPGGYAPPGSQPFAPTVRSSQPYPSGGYAPPGSQPFPPAGATSDDATITSADTPTVRSSQPYPPGPPAGNNGEPPATR